MPGSSIKEQIEEFCQNDEENTNFFEFIKVENNDYEFSIAESFHFTLHVNPTKDGMFTVSSNESGLTGFIKNVNLFLKQGKKTIKQVLANATAEYDRLGAEDTQQDEIILTMDDEIDPIKSSLKIVEKSTELTELEKIRDKFKDNFKDKNASKVALDRLTKDYHLLQQSDLRKFGFSAEPVNGNLFEWEVRLWNFDGAECKAFNEELKKFGKMHNGQDFVKLEMKFPQEYPNLPPFIRVISPRFVFHTGRVTVGGSICFELLTASGWSSTLTLEAIFIQVKLEMSNGKPAIDWEKDYDYSESEAKEAFFRVARDHSWETSGLK